MFSLFMGESREFRNVLIAHHAFSKPTGDKSKRKTVKRLTFHCYTKGSMFKSGINSGNIFLFFPT